ARGRAPARESRHAPNQHHALRPAGIPRGPLDGAHAQPPALLVEIPANTDVMRAKAWELARRWRAETRRIFQHYFAAGYQVEDFIPPGRATLGRCFYVLRRSVRQA